MIDETEELSFHGKLIKVVVENWALHSLFEQNDMSIRNKLADTLKTYLPSIEINLQWNMDPIIVDMQAVAGDAFFIDEHGTTRVLNFYITATGAHIQ